MMEYIFMTLFLMVIIIGLVLFLTGWQVIQSDVQADKSKIDRILFLTNYFTNTPLLAKDTAMLDDSKLDAFEDVETYSCTELEKALGQKWFVEVRNLDDSRLWSFCTRNSRNSSFVIPVNIYNRLNEKVSVGTLKAGVYE